MALETGTMEDVYKRQRVEGVEGEGEAADLARTFNRMADNIQMNDNSCLVYTSLNGRRVRSGHI